MKIHRRELLDAIAAGATTLDELQRRTRAGTGCGTCRFDLLQLLGEAVGAVPPADGGSGSGRA
ncbi:MAG TPA: (2Fe-2S)-binding protein [Planctomycetota bacterium]|nr:(2Fe-2S)-binding protein [Planctomycetota bacterium]